jgi:hypothetical protein
MNDNINSVTDQWFDSTFLILNESYQLDLRRILSRDTFELTQTLSDFHMYDQSSLFLHLLAVTSHYLTSTSLVFADNQLQHKLNLQLLLVTRAGRTSTQIYPIQRRKIMLKDDVALHVNSEMRQDRFLFN